MLALLSGCPALLFMSVEAPILSPAGGSFDSVQSIEISVVKPTGATIRYTTDGSDPSPSKGTIYSVPFALYSNATVKAMAYKTGWLNSKTTAVDYKITLQYRTFTVPDLTTNLYYADPATLVLEGTHCLIYVENASISSVPQASAQSIADQFDNVIYPLARDNFGTEGDVDGNGKVILFILDIRDGYSPGGSYVAGFFNSNDLLSAPHSNAAELLYLDDDPASPSDPSFYPTMAHEFQHMINFNQRHILNNYSAEDTWINEGLSTASEGIYYAAAKPGSFEYDVNRVDYYQGKSSYDNSAIANGENFLSWGSGPDVVAHYVTVYLFFEWMKQQIAVAEGTQSTGSDLFTQIISDFDGNAAGVLSVFANALTNAAHPPTNPGPPASWAEMLRDWFIANYVAGRASTPPILYSYGSTPIPFPLALPYATASGSSLLLYPGDGIYVNSSSWNAASSGSITYLGVNSNGTINAAAPYNTSIIIAFNSDGTPSTTGTATSALPSVLAAPSATPRSMGTPEPMPIDVLFGPDGKVKTPVPSARSTVTTGVR